MFYIFPWQQNVHSENDSRLQRSMVEPQQCINDPNESWRNVTVFSFYARQKVLEISRGHKVYLFCSMLMSPPAGLRLIDGFMWIICCHFMWLVLLSVYVVCWTNRFSFLFLFFFFKCRWQWRLCFGGKKWEKVSQLNVYWKNICLFGLFYLLPLVAFCSLFLSSSLDLSCGLFLWGFQGIKEGFSCKWRLPGHLCMSGTSCECKVSNIVLKNSWHTCMHANTNIQDSNRKA